MKTELTAFKSLLLATEDPLAPISDEQTLRVAAAFLQSAHRARGRQREEAKKLWKRLQSMPRLIVELKRRGLITDMTKAP